MVWNNIIRTGAEVRSEQAAIELGAVRTGRCASNERGHLCHDAPKDPADCGLEALLSIGYDELHPAQAPAAHLRHVLGAVAEHFVNRVAELLPWVITGLPTHLDQTLSRSAALSPRP